MIGAIIGDIVGSRFEFDEQPKDNFELFRPKPQCDYTDDSLMTIAVADAILNGKSYQDKLHEWGRRYPNPKGAYGGMFAQWLADDHPKPQNSWGNGAAMRIAPVGWLFDDYHEVLQQAQQCTICSHMHKEAIRGAQCVLSRRVKTSQATYGISVKVGYLLFPDYHAIIIPYFNLQRGVIIVDIYDWDGKSIGRCMILLSDGDGVFLQNGLRQG